MNTPSHPPSKPATRSPVDAGLSRRRLVRAGLAATPVLAALKSNTVLAGEHSCIRPSSFSSLTAAHMKLSRGREINASYQCQGQDYWKSSEAGLPTGFKNELFLADGFGFLANPQNRYTKLTLQQVLELNGNAHQAALARHVVAAFLSAVSVQDDPGRVLLTRSQLNAIWNGQGHWSPFAGAIWSPDQTMHYFETVFGPAFL
jgi:hypothetical protein